MTIRRIFAVVFLVSLIFFAVQGSMLAGNGSGGGIYEDPETDDSDPDSFDDPDVDFLPEFDEFGNPVGGQSGGGSWDLGDLFDQIFGDGILP